MTHVTSSESTAPVTRSTSLLARLAGVLFSPRATYGDVAARPRWLGALAVVVLVGAAGLFIFLSTEIGKQAMLDQQLKTMESFGIKANDRVMQRMEQGVDRARYTAAIGQAVFLPVVGAIIAAVALGVFNTLMGGTATFKHVFAIVAHSGVILAVAQIFALPLDYLRETMTSPTSLAVFVPFLDEHSFPVRFLSIVDLFQLWWIVSLAIGLGVLYKKRTAPIASGLLSFYFVIALVIAAFKSVA